MNKSFNKVELLILTSVMAFCSIAYELLLSNTLAVVTGDFVWWQSLTIGVFIGGLGIGAYLSSKVRDAYLELMRIELILSFLGIISVIYIYIFHAGYKYADNLFFFASDFHALIYHQNQFFLKTLFFFVTQSLTFLIGFFSGFEVPLMMKVYDANVDEKQGEYQILGVNYVGTLLGTLAFGYLLLPKLDAIKTAVVVGVINLLLCFYFLMRSNIVKKMRYFFVTTIVLALAIFIYSKEHVVNQAYLKLFYYVPRILSDSNQGFEDIVNKLKKYPEIERFKSLYQYLDIIQYPEKRGNDYVESTILTLDTNFQFSSQSEYLYHEGFAHISIMLNNAIPKNVLILGGGDGLLVRELLKYDEIEKIDLVELDGLMIDFATTRFDKFNISSLKNPRVHVSVNDGFYFIRNTLNKYDAIYIDFPYPNSYDLAKLYSVEFYKYVVARLNPNGFIILDAPFYGKDVVRKSAHGAQVTLRSIDYSYHDLNNNVLASTFYYAGLNTFFPYGIGEETFAFLKVKSGEINQNFLEHESKNKLSKDVFLDAQKIPMQHYPYHIAKKYVNSIFKPILVKKN